MHSLFSKICSASVHCGGSLQAADCNVMWVWMTGSLSGWRAVQKLFTGNAGTSYRCGDRIKWEGH